MNEVFVGRGGTGTFSLDTLDKQLKCKYIYDDS